MTIEGAMLQICLNKGYSISSSIAALETVKTQTSAMQGRWEQDYKEYPVQLLAVLQHSLDKALAAGDV